MKPVYLFPNKLKIPALIVFIISIILIVLQFSNISIEINTKVFALISDPFLDRENTGKFIWIKQDIYNEVLNTLFFSSGLILAFAKEKIDDEMITLIRYKSLTITTYFIFGMIILAEIFIYGTSFIYVIMSYFYGFIIFLNIIYYTKLYIYKKQFSHENED